GPRKGRTLGVPIPSFPERRAQDPPRARFDSWLSSTTGRPLELKTARLTICLGFLGGKHFSPGRKSTSMGARSGALRERTALTGPSAPADLRVPPCRERQSHP